MKRQRPVLTELQSADLVLQLAGRVRPAGTRCALADRRGLPELPVEKIEHAVAVAGVVNAIVPDNVRRIVALAMAVRHGQPEFDRRAIAETMCISQSSVTRGLKWGLQQVEKALAALDHANTTRERVNSAVHFHA